MRIASLLPSATEIVYALRSRLRAVAEQVAGRARPRVAMLEWVDPPFAAGRPGR